MDESNSNPANNQIFDMLLKEDEITWQSILQDLVRTEQMDPWDVNITLLSEKFMETIKSLEKADFRVSGKMVLASAILLKMKSNKFLSQDLDNFDKLVNFVDEYEDEYMDTMDELEHELLQNEYIPGGKHELIPRTPQPRKRKVSIFDLVEALEKALEVKRRRPARTDNYEKVEPPKKPIDINEIIEKVQDTIIELMKGRKKMMFDELIPSETKEDKVLTFIPCLHLDNQRTIELKQKQHFGDIEIELIKDISKVIKDQIKIKGEKQKHL
ncbi:MAG: segregation/condensation protein A [Candidatus Woesearchaeota archaeon]